MVLLFVVCGWREEAVAGACLRTYLVHSTYNFLVTGTTKDGKFEKTQLYLHRLSPPAWQDFLFLLQLLKPQPCPIYSRVW